MIKADYKKWARFIYDLYMNRLLKKNFSNFFLVNELPVIPPEKALLMTPNHMSWWDGFFAGYVFPRFTDKNHHVMMLERELSKYRFFRKVGAFSIDPGNEESVRETLDYTAALLESPANLVNMFPQGVLLPYDLRPIAVKRKGMVHLLGAVKKPFTILPLAFKIQYNILPKPEVIARFGRTMDPAAVRDDFSLFENEFRRNIDLLDEASFKREYIHDLFAC